MGHAIEPEGRAGRGPSLPPSRRDAAAVAVVAALARVAVLLATPGYRPGHDDASYARVARSLLSTGAYPLHHVAGGMEPSTYRPPGWPAALAAVWGTIGGGVPAGRVLLVVLGVTACVLACRITGTLAGRTAGIAAGLVLAVDPLVLVVGASLESETLFIAVVLGALAAALHATGDGRHRWRWVVAAGALAGAASLTRTNGLALVPVIAVIAAWGPRRPSPGPAAAAILVAVAVVAPWTVRNALAVHRFVPVSTETGNTLAGTYNTTSLHHDARWLEPTEVGAYRHLYHRFGAGAALNEALVPAVWRWVRAHPAYPAVVVTKNTDRLLGFAGPVWARGSLRSMSFGGRAGPLVGAATGLVSLLALIGLALPGRARALAPLLAVGLVLLLTAAPVNGELRLGAPLQAVLACAAGTALAAAWTRARRWAVKESNLQPWD